MIVKEGVKELINEYFKIDLLDSWPMTEDAKENIIKTFTYAWEHHQTIQSISKQLQNSNLSAIRDRIIKQLASDYNAFPVRLGPYKKDLQKEAVDHKMSLHRYMLHIVKHRNTNQITVR